MKKLVFITILSLISNLYADTNIKVGTLNYSLTKSSKPIDVAPAAQVLTDSTDAWVRVRFPGYKHFYTVDSGFYPGWSSNYNTGSDTAIVTGPTGYTYVFDSGVTDSNDFFDCGHGTTYRLKHILNPAGAIEDRYTYDADGFVERVYDGNDLSGTYLEFAYDDTKSQITSITAVDSSVSTGSFNYSRNYSLSYDSNGFLAGVSNGTSGCGCSSGGSDWLQDVYDPNEKLISQKDSLDQTIYTYSYAADGSLAEKKTGNGDTIYKTERENLTEGYKDKIYNYVDSNFYRYSESIYDSNGTMTENRVYKELRDKRNAPETFDTTYFSTHYISSGSTEIIVPDGAPVDGSGERVQRSYDSDYRLTSVTEYSEVDNTLKSRDSQKSSYTSDDFIGNETDVRGAKTSYEYVDGKSLISKKIMPSDEYSKPVYYLYEYDDQSRMVKETMKIDDSDGSDYEDRTLQIRNYEYDNFGNICKEYLNNNSNRNDSNSLVTEYVYNAFGDLVWQISADGVVSGKRYNSDGELTDEFVLAGGLDAYNGISNPLDCDYSNMLVLSQTKYTYNTINGKKELVQQALADDAFAIDSPARWIQTKYTYDLYGRQASVIEDFGGDNITTSYYYNLQDETVQVTYPTNKTVQTIRDGRGLTVQKIETAGEETITTTNIYDNRNRLVETKVNNTTTKSFDYDFFNRVARAYRGNANSPFYTEYLYGDNTDDVEEEIVYDSDGANSVAISRVFKKRNVLGQLVYQRDYKDAEEDSSVVDDKLTFYSYDGFGNIELVALKGIGNSYSIFSMMGSNYDYLTKSDDWATLDDYYSGDVVEYRRYNSSNQLVDVVKAPTLELTDQAALDFVLNDPNGTFFETFLASNNPDLTYKKYEYVNNKMVSGSVYQGLDDNNEPVMLETLALEYDEAGRIWKQVKADKSYSLTYYNSLGKKAETLYCNAGSDLTITDDDEILSRQQFTYDDAGRLLWEITFRDPDAIDHDIESDRITEYVYNVYGQLIKQGVNTGNTDFVIDMTDMTVTYIPCFAYNEYGYDGFGRKIQTIDPYGNEENLTYNNIWGTVGSKEIVRVSSINENDRISTSTSFSYDFAGRISSITEQDRASNPVSYTYLGNKVVSEELADGTVNEYGYDGFGNKTLKLADSGTGGINQYTYWDYDRLGRFICISGFTDGNSSGNEKAATYDHDYMNNVTKVTYSDNTTLEFTYNKLGKVVERRNRDNNITEYTYDAGGYLYQKNNIFELFTPDENDPNIIHVTRDSKPWQLYGYDELGRLESVCLIGVDGDQQIQMASHSREYDGFGNIVKTNDGHIAGQSSEMVYGYYPNGNIYSVKYPDGNTVTYQSSGMSLVSKISCNDTTLAEYDYIGKNVLNSRLLNADAGVWFTYDARGRVTGEEIYALSTNNTISETTYSYKSNTDLVSSKTIDTLTQSYGYDDLYRLASYGSINYTLNDIGEELTPVSPIHTYNTDIENRITDVNDLLGVELADYVYDGLGRRNKKVVYDGQNVSTVYYVYDIMGRVAAEYGQNGASVESLRNYIYGSQGELITVQQPRTSAQNTAFDDLMSFADAWLCDPNCPQELLVWNTVQDDVVNLYDYVDNMDSFAGAFNPNNLYCVTDKNNSVVGIIGSDNTTWIDYTAWGEPVLAQGDTLQGVSVLWNGYYYDSETDNYYLRNRYYSPVERRFLTDDPHGINPDGNWNNPFAIATQFDDGVGLQVYANFDPLNKTDRWGLFYDPTPWNPVDDQFGDPIPSYEPPDHSDFTNAYFNGNGEKMDLAGTDYATSFRNSKSVKGKVSEFRGIVNSVISMNCENCPSDAITGESKTVTDVTWEVTPSNKALFSIGNSTFYRNYSCAFSKDENCKCIYNCTMTFSIKDWFRDPLDIGVEIPGGTVYPINLTWEESINGKCN